MRPGRLKILPTSYILQIIYIQYIHKQDLVFNNVEELIYPNP